MKRAALLSTALIIIPTITQAQCVATTDCASLGYTETSCPNGGLKCPFANYWSCKESGCSSNQETYDKNDAINCTFGSIYYNDGTCIKEFVSGRIPMGVVAYVDPITKEKWIISLIEAELLNYISGNTSMYQSNWSDSYIDIPEITNYTSESVVISDMKNCENTAAMQANGAATLLKDFAPKGDSATKGNWCLPTAGFYNMVKIHANEIDEGLSKANGTKITQNTCNLYRNYYWTSSEYNQERAWAWDMCSKKLVTLYKLKSNNGNSSSSYYNMRPVMKI